MQTAFHHIRFRVPILVTLAIIARCSRWSGLYVLVERKVWAGLSGAARAHAPYARTACCNPSPSTEADVKETSSRRMPISGSSGLPP